MTQTTDKAHAAANAAAEADAAIAVAAREQFQAYVADIAPNGAFGDALDEQRSRVQRQRELRNRENELRKSYQRSSRPATLAKLNAQIDDVQELDRLNKFALEAVEQTITDMKAAQAEAVEKIRNAFVTYLLADYGKVQYDEHGRATHVEFTPTGPLASGDTYAIVARGGWRTYNFEVGIRADADSNRFFTTDVDVSGPHADSFFERGKIEPSTVNWPATGSQPVQRALAFAKLLTIAATLAQRLDECLI